MGTRSRASQWSRREAACQRATRAQRTGTRPCKGASLELPTNGWATEANGRRVTLFLRPHTLAAAAQRPDGFHRWTMRSMNHALVRRAGVFWCKVVRYEG